ncbi:hypothetical protein [Deinococcus multiflagellatus]|uniref:Uncharacterized protein n=1 Tax=Deinococcus multiflagellatus TaxID=1656887 RepID=A0ABW1ZRA3_9DEIO|nr:hypothetical protein [Deinococcus multiflagellatus]MBZ9715935.1 hypothetical protein [Deinococcus multiflagellatus]
MTKPELPAGVEELFGALLKTPHEGLSTVSTELEGVKTFARKLLDSAQGGEARALLGDLLDWVDGRQALVDLTLASKTRPSR